MGVRAFLVRLVNLFRRSRLDRDLQEQLDTHRALIEADLIERGMAPDEAAAAARRTVGNDLLIRELSGDQMVLRWIDGLVWDVRYAVKGLVRSPGFAAGAAITLALGIGVNVAVFSAVDRFLFRPLPYDDPDRLYVLAEVSAAGEPYGTMAPGYIVETRNSHTGIAAVGLSSGQVREYTESADSDGAPRILAAPVSFNALRVLGVAPHLGRDFTEEDAREQRVLLLVGFDAWRSTFGGAQDVIGRTLWSRTGAPVEIVGVLPQGFVPPPNQFVARSDGLVLDVTPMNVADPRERWIPPFVRLAPNVSLASARAELAVVAERARGSGLVPAGAPAPPSLDLIPIREFLFGRYRTYSGLIFGAASLVLLVACANLAGLILLRSRTRERLAATHMALGAPARRLMRGAAIEGLCLSLACAAVALLTLAWSTGTLRALLPPTFAYHAVPVLDARVLMFSLLVACGTAVAVTVLPVWRLRRLDVLPMIRGTAASGRRRRAGGAALIVVETALGVVLVAGAVTTSRNLVGLLRTDLGFDPAGLYQVTVTLSPATSPETTFRQYSRVLEMIRELPGVEAASGANVQPTANAAGWRVFGEVIDGQRAYVTHVTGGHFETIGQPVLAGRTIGQPDVDTRARVGVLSASGVRRVWPGVLPTDAIGRRLELPGEAPVEIIGVVPDLRPRYASAPDAYLYMPITPDDMRFMMYAVRTAGGRPFDLAAFQERVQRELGPVSGASAGLIADWLHDSVRDERFRAALFSLFGIVALVLAAVGLYAMCAFEVTVRRRELGIRAALGATAAHLRRFVFTEALGPTVLGVAAGVVMAYAAAASLQSFLHEIDARDPWMLALVAGVLLVTAAAAAYVPARRAARTDPAGVLRAN